MDKPITPDTIVVQKKTLPNVVLDEEIALMNTENGRYYSLDPVGTRIWAIMAEQITIKDIVAILLQEYEVTPEICGNDVIDLVKQLNEQGLVNIL
jgi:hypothetical protein